MSTETIDSIKRRMIRNASRIWGYPDVQDINSFDPVLGLIMGALAEEIHAVSREINQADSRVIDKLLEVLFSENVFSHFPAHAVAFAKPVQPRVQMNDFYQFYYTREVHDTLANQGHTTKKNIYFSPTTECVLFNGEVKYLFAGKYLYELEGRLKEIIAETPQLIPESKSKLVLGLQMDPLIDLFDGLSLFFSFRNIREEDRFFHALQAAKWKMNGMDVDFHAGLMAEPDGSEDLLSEMLRKDRDLSYRTGCFINEFYSKKFMTLGKGNYRQRDFLQKDYVPAVLERHFQKPGTTLFDRDIIWVEIDLSQSVSADEMNDLNVSLNSFPVVNRELNEYTHSVVKGTNVIPLHTDDLFFDVRRVTDSRDMVYSPRSSVETHEGERNTYYVREGGVARFDSRDARESIKQLVDLIRDEAAAFTVKGSDLISTELKELDQILTRLHQRIDLDDTGHGQNSYLILESDTEYDKIQIQYWSVAGVMANNIRPGSRLAVYQGIDLDDNTVNLQTPAVGGRQQLSKEDKLNTLRRSLLSKGRIVTVEDMKALCFELFGGYLKKVEVKKGVDVNPSGRKGMSRTLDIFLYLKKGHELAPEDLWHKTGTLKVKLKQESVNLLPYRVFVK